MAAGEDFGNIGWDLSLGPGQQVQSGQTGNACYFGDVRDTATAET